MTEILQNKTQAELIDQYQKLQESHRQLVLQTNQEKAVIIQDRNDLEAKLFCANGAREGVEATLTDLLNKHRQLIAENIKLNQQVAAMQIELDNRQNQLNDLNASEEVTNESASKLTQMSQELLSLAGDS